MFLLFISSAVGKRPRAHPQWVQWETLADCLSLPWFLLGVCKCTRGGSPDNVSLFSQLGCSSHLCQMFSAPKLMMFSCLSAASVCYLLFVLLLLLALYVINSFIQSQSMANYRPFSGLCRTVLILCGQALQVLRVWTQFHHKDGGWEKHHVQQCGSQTIVHKCN